MAASSASGETSGRYTDYLASSTGGTWEQVVNHKFTDDLAAGTLDLDRLAQEALLLRADVELRADRAQRARRDRNAIFSFRPRRPLANRKTIARARIEPAGVRSRPIDKK